MVEPKYGAVRFARDVACEHDEPDGASVGRKVGAAVGLVGAVVDGLSVVGTAVGDMVGAVVGVVAFSEMAQISVNEPVISVELLS